MRNPDPEQRSLANLPRLYQKYIGHDNNRDFFASTQAETENINRVLYHEWFPQILYNHHQSGPAGTVAWSSPQRDPYNYNLDPLLILGLQALGTHMHERLATEGKPGVTMASGGAYDGWWNGGIRNTGNFHNMIAILTETIGSPTPMRVPLVAAAADPEPRPRRIRSRRRSGTSGSRSTTRCRSTAACSTTRRGTARTCCSTSTGWGSARSSAAAATTGRRRRRGSTPWPRRWAAGGAAVVDATPEAEMASWAALRKPELRDPRGYIIPSDQRDFPTAIKFVNALREVERHRPSRDRGLPGQRQALSRGLVRRDDQPGVPSARHGHVRAAGSPQRHRLSRRAADPALRQRRLDAGVPDGRAVRSRARAGHRAVREGDRLERRSRRRAPSPADGSGYSFDRARQTTRSSR